MRALIPALLLSVGMASAVQAEEATAWLSRLAQADRQQPYQGTFIYERNGSFSTHGVWRAVVEGQMRERLYQLDGPEQEVLKVDGALRCIAGSMAEQLEGAAYWPSRSLDPVRLAEHYQFKLAGESRVAGRATQIIQLAPSDQHRYGYELHLDKETGVPLKSLLLSEKGQLLERFQFARFEPRSDIAASDLAVGRNCQAVQIGTPESDSVAWQPRWLPPGFELVGVAERQGRNAHPLVFMTYLDGLARFSVFIESLAGEQVEDARHQLGPTVVVSRRLSAADGDYMVTVVGEIPFGTAERVAVSLAATDGVAATP